MNSSVSSLRHSRFRWAGVFVCLFAVVLLLAVVGLGVWSSVPASAADDSGNSTADGTASVGGTSDDGLLRLDVGVITGSSGGAGSVGDFPVRGELFSPEFNQVSANIMAGKDQLSSEMASRLSFDPAGGKTSDSGYSGMVAKLFGSDYKPVASSAVSSGTDRNGLVWLVLIIAAGVVLIPLSLMAGVWSANRSARRRRLREQQRSAATTTAAGVGV